MKRTTITCPNCGKEISRSNFAKHQRRHIEHPETFEKPQFQLDHDDLVCKFCGKVCKNRNSLCNHERLCKLNPNRQLTSFEKGINTFDSDTVQLTYFGTETADNEHTNQCSYCLRWFPKAKIGGHTTQCRKVTGADKLVKLYPGNHTKVVLDITEFWLAEYRKQHDTCEICGRTVQEITKWNSKYAAKQLCVDHDHKTNKFRGLLCQYCNRQLGWYEKYQNSVNEYLNK